MNGEEPPLKRRRQQQMTILMLPDDLLFNCLARVSRLYHPTLSLVSKRFRSLLASTELYQTRTLLGRTDACLYVCFWLRGESCTLRCFTLGRRPYSSKKVLVPIPPPNFPCATWSDVAVVGPNIYAIGGLVNIKDNSASASSSTMVMDCRSHEWREAPSMRVPRAFLSSCVLDGKIYVTGGCKNLDSTNWMEVFDTKTQTSEFLKIPSEEVCKGSEYKSAVYEGTVYVKSEEKDATFKLNKGRWRTAGLAMNLGWGRSSSHCVIGNVFFRFGISQIDWYDSKERLWRALKGLERLPRLPPHATKLTDYGGKMVVLWQEYVCRYEKHQNGEIWGYQSGLTSSLQPTSHIV